MADIAIPRRAVPRLGGIRRNWSSLVLSLPAIVLILAMFIYPFIFGFDLSLRNKDNLSAPWTLDNYARFFSDPR